MITAVDRHSRVNVDATVVGERLTGLGVFAQGVGEFVRPLTGSIAERLWEYEHDRRLRDAGERGRFLR